MTLESIDWRWLGLCETVWMIVLAIFILLDKRSPLATLAWILGLALLPGLGIPIYLVFGPRRLTRKRRRRALARSMIAADAARLLRESRVATAEGATAGDPAMSLAELAVRAGEMPPFHCDDVRVFLRGDECFSAILDAVGGATHHVHLEYYIFEDGPLARRLVGALVEKAREGVEVRLLVDGLGSRGLRDSVLAPLVAAGGEVAVFQRLLFAGVQPKLLNFRTHRKIVCVDGVIGFTGGMNVQDEQDESVVGAAAWRDTHVRLTGDVVAALELLFMEDWSYATGKLPKGAPYVRELSARSDRLVQIVASGPDLDSRFAIHAQFFAAIANARKRVRLTTPYFVPDEATLMALVTAARRGVDVRVLVPDGGDHPFVSAAARSYFPALLEAGVRVFTYGPRILHAKTLAIDEHYAAIGTANFDNRSFRLNFEVVAAVFDASVVETLVRAFDDDCVSATEVTRLSMKRRSFPAKLYEAVARVFSPIL